MGTHGGGFVSLRVVIIDLMKKRYVSTRGVGTIFFLGGAKMLICRVIAKFYGGHRHIHPIETKSWGGQLPPGSRAPVEHPGGLGPNRSLEICASLEKPPSKQIQVLVAA